MNELQMVRELYDDPPAPSAHAVAAARLRMTREVQPRAGKGRRLSLGLGLGLVAAGTAAVVAFASTTGQSAPTWPGPAQPKELTARQILLAAAESSTKAPAGGGTYWLTHRQLGVAMVAGTGANRYVVERRDERKQWRGVGDRPTTSAERGLGTRPQTPDDVVKWKKAGAPKQFPRDWPAHGTPWQTRKGSPSDDGPFPRAYLKELGDLPADPEKLRARLLKEQKASPADSDVPAARWLFSRGSELLVSPVPPKVRAATYKMLAGVPGIRTVGRATDPLGRHGAAVGMRGAELRPTADELTETQLVVHLETGRLLAQRTVLVRPMSRPMPGDPAADAWPGVVLSYDTYVTAAWTSKTPRP